MSSFNIHFVPDGTFFFTVRLRDEHSDLLVSRIDLFRDATRLCRARWPFKIVEAVVLPNQCHMIWTLPPDDLDFTKRWRLIKSTFSRHVPAPDYIAPSDLGQGRKGIWKPRFWDHQIRDRGDFDIHCHLIALAPMHAGLVKRVSDWPHSSFSKRKQAEKTARLSKVRKSKPPGANAPSDGCIKTIVPVP